MTESTAATSLLPEGWYSDPANADMQHWWTGTDWTDHVRYAEKTRLHAVLPEPQEVVAPPFTPAAIAPAPVIPSVPPVSGFDDFYIPMRGFSGPTSTSRVSTKRASIAAGGLWLLVVASLGVALGVTLWILLPR